MKTYVGALLGLTFFLFESPVHAGDVLKANNTTALNNAGSWVSGGPPGSADVAVWDNTVSGANTTLLGGDMAWQGIRITNPGGTVTVNAGNLLTLGVAGIDLSSSTRYLRLNNDLKLGVSQIWTVAASRILTIGPGSSAGAGVDVDGHTLTLIGAGTTEWRAPIVNADKIIVDEGMTARFFQYGQSTIPVVEVLGGAEFRVGDNQTLNTVTIPSLALISNGIMRVHTRGYIHPEHIVLKNGGEYIVETLAGNRSANSTVGTGGITIYQTPAGTYTALTLANVDSMSGGRAALTLNGDLTLIAHPDNINSVVWASPNPTFTLGDGYISLSSGNRSFDIGDGGADVDFIIEPKISGSGGLIKKGAGTLSLLGVSPSTYTGNTVVESGTLLVNNLVGSGTGTGWVLVESGATLGGSGTISGEVTIESGAFLAPGSLGAGTLNTGPLVLQSGSEVQVDLGAPWVFGAGWPSPNDLVQVTGDLSLAGQIEVSEQAGFSPGTYTLFTYTGTATDNGTTVGSLSGGLVGAVVIDADNKLVNLLVAGDLPPIVTTPTVTDITASSATLGATVANAGSGSLTTRGTVWGTSPTPTTQALAEGGLTVNEFSHLRTGLPAGTLIYYRGYGANSFGTAYSEDDSFFTLSTVPVAYPGSFTGAAASTTAIDLSWNQVASADGYLILQREGPAPAGTPANRTEYTVGETLGNGLVVAVLQNGSITSFTAEGLTAETAYQYIIYPFGYNGVNEETYHYKVDGSPSTTSAQTRPLPPATASSAVEFNNVLTTSMTIQCAPGDGTYRLIVMRVGGAVNAVPIDGTSYTASPVLGSGAQLGSGNYVVYNGSGSAVTVSGLTANTIYHVAIFEYNGSGSLASYQTDVYATGTQSSLGNSTHYVLDEEGVLGLDLSATPSDLWVSGSPPLITYGTMVDTLDMSVYNLSTPTLLTNTTLRFPLDSLTSAVAGGHIDLSGTGLRPDFEITTLGSILLSSINGSTTNASGSGNTNLMRSADVTLSGALGVTIRGTITNRARAVSGSAGALVITSSDGAVSVGGEINSTARYRGNVTLSGTAISVSDIWADRGGQTASGQDVHLTATSGGIIAGDIDVNASTGQGSVRLSSTGGGVLVGSIDSRASSASASSPTTAGTIWIDSAGALTTGPLDSSNARTGIQGTTTVDVGGAITLSAVQDVLINGSLKSYVSNARINTTETLRSRAGNISIISSTGNIEIGGEIDAYAPAEYWGSQYWQGNLALTASQGSIRLLSLDVSKVGEIRLLADASKGTALPLALLGLDAYLDKVNNTVGRFTEVTGNIYYFNDVAANAYLEGRTYEIEASVGGPFYLTLGDPVAPHVTTPIYQDLTIDRTSVTWGGTIAATGGEPAIERGVYWSTTADFIPPGQGTKVSEVGAFSTGDFTIHATSLPPGKLLYFRAFASNSGGLGYSAVSKIVTRPPEGTGYLVDFEDVSPQGSGSITMGGIEWLLGPNSYVTATSEIEKGLGNYTSKIRYRSAVNERGYMEMQADKPDGVGYVTLYYTSQGSSAPVQFVLEYSINGGADWLQAGDKLDTADAGDLRYYYASIQQPGHVRIRLRVVSGNNNSYANIDHIELHDFYDSDSPIVTAPTYSSLSSTSAVLGATLASGVGITARGTVWGTSLNPTVNSKAEGGTGLGVYAHARTGMPEGTLIYFRGYAVNASGTTYSDNGSFYTLSAEPSAHPLNFEANGISSTDIQLSWIASAGASGYLIVRNEGALPSGLPEDAVGYSVGDSLGDGTIAAILSSGTTETTVITGLSPGSMHSFKIYPFSFNGINAATHNYITDGTVPSASAQTFTAPPDTAASSLQFSLVGSTRMTVGWTSGSGLRRVVLMRTATAIDAFPVSGRQYTPNALLASGDEVGSGNWVVYDGPGDSVTVTGLSLDTLYQVAVFEYNGAGDAASYKTDTYLSGSQLTLGQAVDYMLTADSAVGFDLHAIPEDLPVKGALPSFTYGSYVSSLDLDAYTITSAGLGDNADFTLKRMTYKGTEPHGGILDFSGPLARGSITINAEETISLRSITTSSSSTPDDYREGSGNVSLTAPNGITIQGDVLATHSGNSSGGHISLTAEDGIVSVGGQLRTGIGRRPGTITVLGRAVSILKVDTDPTGQTGDAGLIEITSTAGSIQIGSVIGSASQGSGGVRLSALGGTIQTGEISTRNRYSGTNGRTIGDIEISTDQGLSVGALNSSGARTSNNATRDRAGNIQVTAVNDITVAGTIETYVSSFSTGVNPSTAGDISITSTVGSIIIQGAIDASAPDGNATQGHLCLSAVQGNITLDSLKVSKLADIHFRAGAGLGTTILGSLEGLEEDITDGDIDRFASVSGNVYYDPGVNAYLNTATYEIINSFGGTYYLTPIPLAVAPSTAASSITFSSVGLNEMTIGWTSGNGANRLVVLREATAAEEPTQSTAYLANSVFGSGSLIGSGSYVVYKGSGNSVTVTGLNPDTLYFVAVFEYGGQSGWTSYKLDEYPTAQRATLSDAQIELDGASHAISFAGLSEKLPPGVRLYTGATIQSLGVRQSMSGLPLSWADTSGGFKNFASTNDLVSTSPLQEQISSPHRALGIRPNGAFGSPGAAFTFVIKDTVGFRNIKFAVDLLMLSVQSKATIWTIDYRVGSVGYFIPLGTYSDPSQWGGTRFIAQLGVGANNQTEPVTIRVVALAVATGSGTTWDSMGLANAVLTYEPAVATVPTLVSPTVSGLENTTATLGARITGDGGSAIIERGTVWGLLPNPTANGLAEGGNEMMAFIHERTGLPAGARVYFRGYADNATGRGYSPTESFVTAGIEPSAHVSSFSATALSSSSISLSWTPEGGGADGVLILMRQNSAPIAVPEDSTVYAVDAALQDATVAAIIHDGAATGTVLSGLNDSTLHYFAIYPFSYNGVNEGSINYLTDPIIPRTSATTLSPLYVARWTFPNQGNFAANALADAPPVSLAINQNEAISMKGSAETAVFNKLGYATYAASAKGWEGGTDSTWWQVRFNTENYGTLLLSSKQRSSPSGPRLFAVQYSLDELVWFPLVNVPNVADNFTAGRIVDVALPQALGNQSEVFVRWLMRGETSVSGGSVASLGESYIDDILVKGVAESFGTADLQVTVAAPAIAYLYQDVMLTITVSNRLPIGLSSVLLAGDLPANAEWVSASNGGLKTGTRVSWSIEGLSGNSAVQRWVVIRAEAEGVLNSSFQLYAAETPVNASRWSANNSVSVQCDPTSVPVIVPSNHTVRVNQSVSFPVQAYRMGCSPDALTITTSALPTGANLAAQQMNGQYMERTFTWTPSTPGTYALQIEATDGLSSTSRVMLVYVAAVGEALIGGVPASQVNWSPEILSVNSRSATDTEIIWATTAGITYVLYSSGDIPGGAMSWTPERTVSASGAEETWTVEDQEDRRYYQVAPLGQSPNPNTAWALIRPTFPAGYSMRGPPLVTDRKFNGAMGALLADALTGRATYAEADKILIWDGGIEGWRELWLDMDGKVWREASNNQVSALELNPGQGFFVERINGGVGKPTFVGRLGNDGSSITTVVNGWNVLSLSEGRQVTIGRAFSNIISGNGPVGATLESSDQVILQLPNGAWVSFVRTSLGVWRNMATGDTSGNFVLEPGMGYYYYRQNSGGNMTFRF